MSRCLRPTCVAVFLAAVLTVACKFKHVEAEVEPPPRPKNVPESAVWAGGIDGGSFIVLEPMVRSGTYAAKIYDDGTGDIVFDGALQLDQSSGPALEIRNPKTFGFWDGDTLHLRDGRSLTPPTR